MSIDALLRVLGGALNAADVPFMLTGSVASAFHGAGRATMDIDFVIDPTETQLQTFLDAVIKYGSYVSPDAAHYALAQRTMFNVVDPDSGWKADLIIKKNRKFSQTEFERRELSELFGVSVHVATLEDLVLSKLEWAKLGNSARQLDDVRALLRLQDGRIDTVYVEQWIDVLGVRAQWDTVHL